MVNPSKIINLKTLLEPFYLKKVRKLLFHGWHHVSFVSKKAVEFANLIGADAFLVETAALVHDLNYAVKSNSEPEIGRDLRKDYLKKAGYSKEEIKIIENIVTESHTKTRTKKISKEGMSLSDADTLFKSLPITPILFASKYIIQNKIDIAKLADKICSEQNRLMKQGIYFYTKPAKKYLKWAKNNLILWNNVNEALKDKDISETVKKALN